MVVLQNSMDQDAEFGLNGLQTSPYETGEYRMAQFDISFIFLKNKNGLELSLEYNTDIYSTEQIQRILKHFENIIASVLQNPKQSLAGIDFLTKEDKHQLLDVFNNTTVEYSRDKTIVDLFEEQVMKTPGNKAVIFEDVELSYQELNILSNQFGDYLRKNYQIKPDDLVAIMLERSEWMVVAIFGILKAGGAFVPIDPDYPQERINYLIKDSGCKVLVDEPELEKFKKSQNKYNQENQSTGLQPNNLAYCIYTSDPTGNPKGCLLQHTGLVNRLEWVQKVYRLTSNDVVLQKTTSSSVISIWELIWWAMLKEPVFVCYSRGLKKALK